VKDVVPDGSVMLLVVNWHQETEADGGVITYYREE
jgi:hypothetical protein